MKKPRCKKCGQEVHPAKSAIQSYDIIFSETPSYCPHCGAKLSYTMQKQGDKFTVRLTIVKCIPFIVFIIFIIILIMIF